MFTAVLFIIMEETNMSTDRGMNKADVHVYNGVYHSAIKKKPIAAIWIDQIIILSEDRERQTSDIAYIVHQKNDTNQVCICLQNRNNHRLRIQTYGHQRRTER